MCVGFGTARPGLKSRGPDFRRPNVPYLNLSMTASFDYKLIAGDRGAWSVRLGEKLVPGVHYEY